VVTALRWSLIVAALATFTVAAWSVGHVVGLIVAGVCLLVLVHVVEARSM